MKLVIHDSKKAEQFAIIFRHLTQLADYVSIYFTKENISAQGMDDSHVCLFEFQIMKSWFDEYEYEQADATNIALKTKLLFKVINTKEENQSITLSYHGDTDKLDISFECENKEAYNKYFELSLITLDQDLLNISDYSSQVDMIFPSKRFATFIEQLEMFNDTVNINCDEDNIKFTTSGDEGSMKVNMDIDDLIEYVIEEDKKFNATFSLSKLHLMCQFNKISSEVAIGFVDDNPMEMKYNLDNFRKEEEGEIECINYIRFYLAPKIIDDE
jgi:proliferating cell nuclear antigen PCNA